MKPHKHAEWIKKFVDGARVRGYFANETWRVLITLEDFDNPALINCDEKPCEFIEGRWYPVVDKDGNKHVCYYAGGNFWATLRPSGATMSPGFFKESDIKIGNPLPEIEWPEGL